jgi:coenzyme F420-reducing hydrogenase beta subunit
MDHTPKVLTDIVKNNLCIGCGLCVYKCPSNALKMNWNDYGFLEPVQIGVCDHYGDCINVCPFNINPVNEIKTENEIARIFLDPGSHYHAKIGYYFGIYAGFSNEFRLSSSSGGLATYISQQLLEKNVVKHIISVKESSEEGLHYEYAVVSSPAEVLNATKTKYYPVTLSQVLSEIDELEGNVAIVGVGCFIKAIRLAQYYEPSLKEKVSFLIGIICGGIKSSFFTEYLGEKAGVKKGNISKPQFRVKDIRSKAFDYSFSCYDLEKEERKTLKMRTVGDMWGTGLFKGNACDFCDDVTTELADISLGDAWLYPFYEDGRGTNVIVTRSKVAEELIHEGIKNNQLQINHLTLDDFLASQQGSFNHRHLALSYRIEHAKKQNKHVPPKRHVNEKISFHFKMVQRMRMKLRERSLVLWRENYNAEGFDFKMHKYLFALQRLTYINHFFKRLNSAFQKLFT